MDNKILVPKKIYVDKSPIHGWGVFALEKIFVGELIEECPILSLPMKFGEVSGLMLDYRFNWPSGTLEWEEQVISLGFGSLYNHSETPNAQWKSNNKKRTFEFTCVRDIEPNEEIFVWYGDVGYWNDGRDHVNLVS
jgi:hypothetical protein